MTTTKRVLVTGATGYVGGRLVPRLLAAGHHVRVLVRSPQKLDEVDWRGDVEIVKGSLDDADVVADAAADVDVLYYLVHSMGDGKDFVNKERDMATTVARAAETETVIEMLRRPWPGLILERIDAAALPLQVRVGWTGEPADTPSLVGKVRRTARIPDALLERSDALVRDFVTLLRTGNDAAAAAPAGTAPDAGTGAGGVVPEVDVALARIVPAARALLAELAELRGTVIETPELTALCEAARAAGWNGKSSGAGGGDCGIALAAAGRDPEELSAAWRREGIRPLDLAVSPAGLRLHQPAQAHQPAPAPDHPNHQPTDPEGSTS